MTSCFSQNTHIEIKSSLAVPDRALRDAFNSANAAVLFKSLEHWFSKPKFRDGFYKFLQPCKKHALYRGGDSWEEDLKFGKKLFNKCFDMIGVRYKSKTAFMKEDDPFKGKLFASYYDRKGGRTYYVRNHRVVEDFIHITLKKYTEIFKKSASSKSKQPTFFSPKALSRKAPMELSSYIDIQENTSSSLEPKNLEVVFDAEKKEEREIILNSQNEGGEGNEKDKMVASGMVYIWEELIEQKIILDPQLAERLVRSFEDNFKSSLSLWKDYCKTIASSQFLMGEVPGTKFEIKLGWAIQKEAIEKILCGHFSLGDRIPASIMEFQSQKEVQKTTRRTLSQEVAKLERAKESIREEVKDERRRLANRLIEALKAEEKASFEEAFLKEQAEKNSPISLQHKDFMLHLFMSQRLQEQMPCFEKEVEARQKERGLIRRFEEITAELAHLKNQSFSQIESSISFDDFVAEIKASRESWVRPAMERVKGLFQKSSNLLGLV